MAVCGALACSAIVSAQQRVQPDKRIVEAVTSVQGFSVVLVLGDFQGGATADNVPPASRKALADMKDFLPYKSYRLLDSGWILGSSQVSQRLRGPEDQEYELHLSAYAPTAEDPRKLHITFTLREADTPRPNAPAVVGETAARATRMTKLLDDRRTLERDLQALQAKYSEKHPNVIADERKMDQLRRQILELENQGRAEVRRPTGEIINTGFSMDVGETVVVGTSRLRGGDKALIALLTAVPRK
jgi:hypothetical protein